MTPTSGAILRALAQDFTWHTDLRAAWRAGLPLAEIAEIVRRESPRHLSDDEAILVADAATELLADVCS